MALRDDNTGPLWSQLFRLPEHPGLTLQARLRLAIVQVILDGRLPPGTPMPSSRLLAKVLSISRNTVTAAYLQLTDEGYLVSRARSGVSIAENARQPDAIGSIHAIKSSGTNWSMRVRRSLKNQRTLSKPEEWRDYPFPFVYGTYDPQLFPTEDFRECCMRSLSRVQLPQWAPDFETGDVPDLIEQIRLRLLPKRGVLAHADEILITVGAQQAYYLLADALFDEHTRVALEEPGHPHARNAFMLHRPQLIPVPVDKDGLAVDALPAVDYVFVTPSHQSPTTSTLSLLRRQTLLQRAIRENVIIIEDDYEAENLYEGTPMPALKSLDQDGRVIYIGSLSKSLSPALRLGYVVAPAPLIAELRALRLAMVRHPSAFLQHAYALFLSLGHHDSHARRVNQCMQERMSEVELALQRALPDFRFSLPLGGASVWVEAPSDIDTKQLENEARRFGVLIEPGEAFFYQTAAPTRYFRLRLSSIPTAHIGLGINALARAVDAMRKCHDVRANIGTCSSVSHPSSKNQARVTQT